MDLQRISHILSGIEGLKTAVYGDFALDAYWMLDPRGSEVSVETGLKARAVRNHDYSPGGAANVACNMLALRPLSVSTIGAIGDDIFGRELVRLLKERGADTGGLIVQKNGFDTLTFVKRYLLGEEQTRIDFGARSRRSPETNSALLEHIETALQQCDALVLNQQAPGTFDDPPFVSKLKRLLKKYDRPVVIIDSRHCSDHFPNTCRKLNEAEAMRLGGIDSTRDETHPCSDIHACAATLFRETGQPVFITRGERGMLAVDAGGACQIPGIEFLGQVDPVGAGDAATATLALSLAAGANAPEAAHIANYAAAVTITKLFQTGTASPREILSLADNPDLLYEPELADRPDHARRIGKTGIELCIPRRAIPSGAVQHVVFDNDGTISVLRRGWEGVMEDMMVDAITGNENGNAPPAFTERVRNAVRDYIRRSGGVQTIVQMEHLRSMVLRFEAVPAEKILDAKEYKEHYNDRLMRLVNRRLDALRNGRMEPADCTIRGAIDFLSELSERGVTLHLASGTDRNDVRNELEALGCDHFFTGGIHGSVGDVTRYSKKKVIADIIREHRLKGPELAVIGDGPVEMREGRKQGGIPVGIASDETRRHGLNLEKRRRLIRAGALAIAPDFSAKRELLDLLLEL